MMRTSNDMCSFLQAREQIDGATFALDGDLPSMSTSLPPPAIIWRPER